MTPSFSLRRYGPAPGRHAHDHAQVLWALDGALELEVSGRGKRVSAGQGLVIAPGELHDFEAPGGSRCLVLDTVDPAWLLRAPRPGQPAAVEHLARFLAASLEQGLPVSAGLGARLLAQAWGPAAAAPARSLRAVDWEGLACWAQARLSAPLAVADLAARAGLSESQFRARCVSALGCTPMQWLRSQRLERARALRLQGLPVALVAQRVGYDSPSALTAALRREG